ncbi:MAG: tRNA lysidine(34) synthetase TilS [Candidatus Alcyoniella australis]|nr:tRNA lysidine(34) synthetase TilS [Candidatus Alcyoniella australis]
MLAAYSGGPDSHVLLHLLHSLREEFGLKLAAAHLHHGLRGAEADADLEHCRAVAADLDVELYEGRAQVRAGEQSVQGEARKVREAFLENIAREHGLDKIATGHNADDVIETLVFRLSRGTGIHGLAGIPEKRGPFVRPLLPFRRTELIEYARQCSIEYRVDSSNRDPHYTRNRIRHEVLPVVYQQLGQGTARSILRLARIARLEDEALDHLAVQAEQELVKPDGRDNLLIEPNGLRDLPEALALRVLRIALGRAARFEISSRHLELCRDVVCGLAAQSRADLPRGLRIERLGDTAWIGPETAQPPVGRPFDPVPLAVPGLTRLPGEHGSIEVLQSPAECQTPLLELDAERIVGELCCRTYRFGDRYAPQGSSGEQKLKQLFDRLGFKTLQRRQCLLLVDSQGVIGGSGLPVAQRVAPNQVSKSIIWVRFR